MIKIFEASNYKSIKQLSLPLGPFNLLVGPNGAGKTNVIRALELFGLILSRGTTDPASDLGWSQVIRRERKLPARGGIHLSAEVEIPPGPIRRSLFRAASDAKVDEPLPVTVKASIKLAGSVGSDIVRVTREELTLRRGHGALVVISDEAQGFTAEPGNDPELLELMIPFSRRIRNRDGAVTRANFQDLMLDALEAPLEDETDRRVLRVLNFQRNFSPWLDYFIGSAQVARLRADASALRGEAYFSEGSRGALGPSGQGLAMAVDRLRGRGGTPKRAFQRVLAALQDVYPRIENVRAVRVQPGRLTLVFKEVGMAEELGTENVSDGVLHALALLVMLEGTDDQRGIIAIEEPENAIHPWSVRAMVRRAQDLRTRQILMTTHSETVVDAVKDPSSLLLTEHHGDRGTTVTPAKSRVQAIDAILHETGQSLSDIWMGGSLGGVPEADELRLFPGVDEPT